MERTSGFLKVSQLGFKRFVWLVSIQTFLIINPKEVVKKTASTSFFHFLVWFNYTNYKVIKTVQVYENFEWFGHPSNCGIFLGWQDGSDPPGSPGSPLEVLGNDVDVSSIFQEADMDQDGPKPRCRAWGQPRGANAFKETWQRCWFLSPERSAGLLKESTVVFWKILRNLSSRIDIPGCSEYPKVDLGHQFHFKSSWLFSFQQRHLEFSNCSGYFHLLHHCNKDTHCTMTTSLQ